jgi:hypothetical protein
MRGDVDHQAHMLSTGGRTHELSAQYLVRRGVV